MEFFLSLPGFISRSKQRFPYFCDFPDRLLHQPAHRFVLCTGHNRPTVAGRDQDPFGAALSHSRRHGWGNLPKQGVGNHNPNGASDDIGGPAAYNHRVFPGGCVVRARLEHGSGSGAVCAHCGDYRVRQGLPDAGYQGAANPAALGVNNQNIHAVNSRFSRRPRQDSLKTHVVDFHIHSIAEMPGQGKESVPAPRSGEAVGRDGGEEQHCTEGMDGEGGGDIFPLFPYVRKQGDDERGG